MENLSLEIFDLDGSGSKYAALPEDASITITDTSEIFASGDVWSHPFTLNVFANAHIFGTAGDIHGSRLHDRIDRRKARLWVCGLPLYLGVLRLGTEAEVDQEGNVDVSFESGHKTFEDMIDGAKASQVPMIGDVRFGVALWRKRKARSWVQLSVSAKFDDGSNSEAADVIVPYAENERPPHGHSTKSVLFESDGEDETTPVQLYPRMVFPKGDFVPVTSDPGEVSFGGSSRPGAAETEHIDCINTDHPYTEDADGTPTHPYCNVALCYQKYGYTQEDKYGNKKTNYSEEPVAQRGYEVMPADRVNSAPNFFVIYWIRALMKHLGIHIDENQMMDVEDLRRLFFVNTKCAYRKPKVIRGANHDEGFGRYMFTDSSKRLIAEYIAPEKLTKVDECQFVSTEGTTHSNMIVDPAYTPIENPQITGYTVKVKKVEEMTDIDKTIYENNNCYLHDAFATGECFPDEDISSVISAIEHGFGVRFLFSDNYTRVRIVLLRNIFRSNDVQEIVCDVISESKVENAVRGFRMTYGNSEDTAFFYKGFDDKLPKKKPYFIDTSDEHDYSQWNTDAVYADIMKKVSAFDKTCYVTPETGNAYGIKIDKDAKRYYELHPALMEYAGYMDAEDGDCTGDDETIETIEMGFTPAIMNDVNMEKERSAESDSQRKQVFALFVDETMRPRREDLKDLAAPESYNDPDAYYDVDKMYKMYGPKGTDGNKAADDGIVMPGEFAITSDMFAAKEGMKATVRKTVGAIEKGLSGSPLPVSVYARWNINLDVDGYVNEGYRLYLQDNFEPNDDGVAPIETHNWGLTLGIMRGSGSDASVAYWGDPDDGEGNDTWDIFSGSSITAHPDTCDSYGNRWVYPESRQVAISAMSETFTELFPTSNASFAAAVNDGVDIFTITDGDDTRHSALLVTPYRNTMLARMAFRRGYIEYLCGHTPQEVMAMDTSGHGGYDNLIVELDSSMERCETLREMIRLTKHGGTGTMTIDNGVSANCGRISLKLRAEKPNPDFDRTQEENSTTNRRYLKITGSGLAGRGLADSLYSEYSLWVRNARIGRKRVKMELAQLLAIDKTKKTTIGDITGFIRKMQYSVSQKNGLGMVDIDIMYI